MHETWIKFAKEKYDEDTFKHCMRMYNTISREQHNDDLRFIAIFHDLLEDTNCTINHLRVFDMHPIVYEAIELLTRNKDITYNEYINRIVKSNNIYAIYVKLYDLFDHIAMTETLKPSLKSRYLTAIATLSRGLLAISPCWKLT